MAVHCPLYRCCTSENPSPLTVTSVNSPSVPASGLDPKKALVVMCSMQAFLAALGLLVLKGYSFPIVIGLLFVVVVFVSYLRLMVISRAEAPAAPKLATSSIPQLEKQPSSTPPTDRAAQSVFRPSANSFLSISFASCVIGLSRREKQSRPTASTAIL